MGKDAAQIDCYVLEDPCVIDILTLARVHADARSHFMIWETVSSDIAGCVSLVSPAPLQPDLSLDSPNIPILCLMAVGRSWVWTCQEDLLP